jgi:hypothetical protein
LFWDGVGLAGAGPDNPLAGSATPVLLRLLGGPLTLEQVGRRAPSVTLTALDATLGVAGLPQSATGQTALFTGQNGAALLGHHVAAFPGPRLRAIIEEHSVFRRLVELGQRATFANPFTPVYWAALDRGERRASVTTCAVRAAGLRFRDLADLAAGRAVTWDVTGESFRAEGVTAVSPATAGRALAALAAEHDVTLHESFLPDLAAHRRFGIGVEDALARLDGLLGGVLEARPEALTVVMTSDHGNLEDATQRLHTRNPVPLLAAGPRAAQFGVARSLLDVTPLLLAR